MEYMEHAGGPVAVLSLQDLRGEPEALAALIDEAIERGCAAFILPSDMVKRGLGLLKGGLIETLRQRFSRSNFRAVITGPLPALSGMVVKSLVKAYGVEDSVFFAETLAEALEKLA